MIKTITARILFSILIIFFKFLPYTADGFYDKYENAIKHFSIVCHDTFIDTNFKKDEPVTRATFLKILFCENELNKNDIYANTVMSFTDITGDEDFILQLKLALFWDAIKGFDDNTFKPNKNITTLETIKTILTLRENINKSLFGKYLIHTNLETQNSNWINQYLNYAKKLNLLNDIDKKIYKNITRNDLLEILYRLDVIEKTNTESYIKNSEEKLSYVTFLVTKEQQQHLNDFKMVNNLLTQYYIYPQEMDSPDPYKKAIKGMVDGLRDPYTATYESDVFSSIPVQLDQVDIGFTLNSKRIHDEDYYFVDEIDRNSEAYKLGLRKGQIVDMMNLFASPVTTDEQTNKNDELLVVESRHSIYSNNPKIITTTINIEKENNVEAELLDNDILYLRIRIFDENSASQLQQINDTLKIYPHTIKGYILDLRGNLGGKLSSLMDISKSLFKKGSTVFISEDKFGNKMRIKTDEQSKRTIWRKSLPWTVLINRNTASASEVLTRSILYNKKDVTILGEPSYGKGKMQSTLNLDQENFMIAFTIGKMFSPDGHETDNISITPDTTLTIGELFTTFDRYKDKSIHKAIESIHKKHKK